MNKIMLRVEVKKKKSYEAESPRQEGAYNLVGGS